MEVKLNLVGVVCLMVPKRDGLDRFITNRRYILRSVKSGRNGGRPLTSSGIQMAVNNNKYSVHSRSKTGKCERDSRPRASVQIKHQKF